MIISWIPTVQNPVIIVLLCVALVFLTRVLLRQLRDGWRHARRIRHAHAECCICAPWARVGIDVQDNGKRMLPTH